jgi:hypothetical protein
MSDGIKRSTGRSTDMTHRLSALTATAGAMAAAAVLATSGSAQTQTTTLHFVSTPERGAGFAPKGAPHPGDRLGFGSKITGDDTGFGRGTCTVVGKKGEGGQPCTIWVHLSRGTLALQGLLPERARNTPIAVTGGTGAYNGARGTALVTDLSTGKTTIKVGLL